MGDFTVKKLFFLLSAAAIVVSPVSAFPADFTEITKITKQGKAAEFLSRRLQDARDAEGSGSAEKAYEAYLDCAKVTLRKADYQLSMRYADMAIAMAEKSGNERRLCFALILLGQTWSYAGQYQKAMEVLKRATAIADERDYKVLKVQAYGFLAAIEIEHFKNYKEGLTYIKWMDNFYDEQIRRRTPVGFERWLYTMHFDRNYVFDLTMIARAYIRTGNNDLAYKKLKTCLFYYKHHEDLLLDNYYWLGILLQKKGEHRNAIEFFEKALALLTFEKGLWSASINAALANSYQHTGALEKSSIHYSNALSSVESKRSLAQSQKIRQSFLERNIYIYEDFIGFLSSQGKIEEAFNVSERERARTLLDILGTRVNLDRDNSRGAIGEEQEYLRRVNELMLQLQASREEDPPDHEYREEIRREISNLDDRYAAFLAELARTDPEQESLLSVDPLTAKEVQALLEPGSKLIEFHILRDKLLVWTVTGNRIAMNTVHVSREGLVGKIKDLRTLLESVDSNRSLQVTTEKKDADEGANAKKTDRILRELYDLLFNEVPLARGEKLIIVPHGVLHYLPFQALKAPDGKYLVEKFPISNLSSASLLKFIQEKRKSVGESLLAFGNPDFGIPAMQLKYAEQEVKDIGLYFPNAKILLGADATKQNAQNLSGNYNLLHFATHADLNEEAPLETSLLLARDKSGEIAKLTVQDIFQLRLKTSLVVLSACETMLGSLSNGDELIGFNRAFFYAGTPSIITTLWKIDDRASSLLMNEFYRNLKSLGKSQALRSAQLSVKEKFDHPYFWAAFILSGDF
jgi:CHAT domain-containing protein